MNNSDKYQGRIPDLISAEELKKMMELNQVKSVLAIVLEWLAIGLAIWLSESYFNIFTYFLAVIWIGARLHGLGVLMHDGSHYRILKNKKLNDIVSEIFLAWPLTITMYGYRKTHWDHHRFLNTEKDPDWMQDIARKEFQFPKTRKEMLVILFKYLIGYYAIQEFKNASGYTLKIPSKITVPRNLLYLAIFLSSIVFGFWLQLIMYWLVPLMTTFLFFMYVRAVADHHAGPDHKSLFSKARTIKLHWIESVVIAPWNINYHVEHHSYPGVPFYNLKKLHKILMNKEEYSKTAHVTPGVVKGLIKECEGKRRE